MSFIYQPMTAAHIYSVQKDIPQQVYTDCPLCVICWFHLIIFSKLIVCIYHFLLLLVLKFRLIWGTCHEAVWLITTCFQVFSVHHCIVSRFWVSGSYWGINAGGGGMHLNPSTGMPNIRSSSHLHLCSEFWASLGYMRLSLSTPPPWKRLFPLNLVDVPPVFHTVCCIVSWLLRYNLHNKSVVSCWFVLWSHYHCLTPKYFCQHPHWAISASLCSFQPLATRSLLSVSEDMSVQLIEAEHAMCGLLCLASFI